MKIKNTKLLALFALVALGAQTVWAAPLSFKEAYIGSPELPGLRKVVETHFAALGDVADPVIPQTGFFSKPFSDIAKYGTGEGKARIGGGAAQYQAGLEMYYAGEVGKIARAILADASLRTPGNPNSIGAEAFTVPALKARLLALGFRSTGKGPQANQPVDLKAGEVSVGKEYTFNVVDTKDSERKITELKVTVSKADAEKEGKTMKQLADERAEVMASGELLWADCWIQPDAIHEGSIIIGDRSMFCFRNGSRIPKSKKVEDKVVNYAVATTPHVTVDIYGGPVQEFDEDSRPLALDYSKELFSLEFPPVQNDAFFRIIEGGLAIPRSPGAGLGMDIPDVFAVLLKMGFKFEISEQNPTTFGFQVLNAAPFNIVE